MTTVYLVGFLNKKVSPPVLEGAGIYTAPANELTYMLHKHFLFDIVYATGNTYELARKNLLSYIKEFHSWVIPFIR